MPVAIRRDAGRIRGEEEEKEGKKGGGELLRIIHGDAASLELRQM